MIAMSGADKPDIAAVSEKSTTGQIDPSIWDEAKAVTGRPNDEPSPNSTFGERAKSAKPAKAAEADSKPAAKKTAARKK